MKSRRHSLASLMLSLLLAGVLVAQEAAQLSVTVPRLVNFSGKVVGPEDKPVSGIAGIAFSIYKDQYEGAPLWMETQNVTADAEGNYSVQLGATKPQGLPLDLFSSGEARWLGVRINNGEEQPRVLLLSVPYALKAADAQTLGGLPASAFLLAGSTSAVSSQTNAVSTPSSSSSSPAASSDVTTSGGTVSTVPLFTTATNVQSSILTQTGSGSTGRIGINTTSPASTLDVNGGATVRGIFTLPAAGTATSSGGKNSQPQDFIASVFNSSTSKAVPQKFQWQAEALNNHTATASGTLNLLYASGTGTPAETGLKINSKGQLTFAAGQTFPGNGSGTVTSVGLSAPNSDFSVSGSPVKASGTLGLAWNIAPTSADTANAIVKRDATGSFNATSITAVVSNGSVAVTGNDQSSGGSSGVVGTSLNGKGLFGNSSNGDGVYGQSGSGIGVQGLGGGSASFGVYGTGLTGVAGLSNGNYIGVYGSSSGSGSYGVFGLDSSGTGVYGSGTVGVSGISTDNAGVYAQSGPGGWAVDAVGTGSATGILAGSSSGDAGFFLGDVDVDGNLSKAGGSFKIDHPLDPANKYLYHSFVESPDMKNMYDGTVTTDAQGDAVINLPEWFEVLNRDFRYQLTVVGQFAQAIVASEVSNHQFSIKTDKPKVKVSWQVTGIRQDAWANAHRIPVEKEKPEVERGSYLHPELYGAPEEKGILWATAPQAMKRWKQARTLAAAQSAKDK
jgi:hypothetical protein